MESTPRHKHNTRQQSGKVAPQKPIVDPISDVINKYMTYQWIVIRPPSGGMNDLIAQKGKKLHFVQVVVDADAARHQGVAKNTFIQNAFSNSAQPIYAHAVYSNKLGENNRPIHTNVIFEDVNQNTRVIIGAKKAAATEAPSADCPVSKQ